MSTIFRRKISLGVVIGSRAFFSPAPCKAARDDVHGFVIDGDAVRRQWPGDRTSCAAYFDLDGGQAAQLRERELQALLREQQPLQEQRAAAGQRQQHSKENDGTTAHATAPA